MGRQKEQTHSYTSWTHPGLIMHFSLGEDVASLMLNLVQEQVLDIYKQSLEWKHTECVKSF